MGQPDDGAFEFKPEGRLYQGGFLVDAAPGFRRKGWERERELQGKVRGVGELNGRDFETAGRDPYFGDVNERSLLQPCDVGCCGAVTTVSLFRGGPTTAAAG